MAAAGAMDGLAWAGLKLHVWLAARLLPLLVRRRSFDAVLRLAPLDLPIRYDGVEAEEVVALVARAVRRPWLMRERRCLREGLLATRFLRYAGYDPELLFGIDPASLRLDRLSAHCWVCLDGRPVVSDRLPGMVTIYRHGPAQSRRRLAA